MPRGNEYSEVLDDSQPAYAFLKWLLAAGKTRMKGWVCLFQNIRRKKNVPQMRQTVWCVPFWVWLTALNMTIYIPSVLQTVVCAHSSSPQNKSPLCVHTPGFLYLPIDSVS